MDYFFGHSGPKSSGNEWLIPQGAKTSTTVSCHIQNTLNFGVWWWGSYPTAENRVNVS